MAAAVAKGRVGNWLRTEISCEDAGNLHLRWWRDDAALGEAERRDGLYALVTNMSTRQCSPERLLGLYKDQALSERAHHFLKGPLAVRPVFLKSNRRAAALVGVCSIALLVYGLIEAETRQAIAPARTTGGLEEIADPLTPAQQAILDALAIPSILPSRGGA